MQGTARRHAPDDSTQTRPPSAPATIPDRLRRRNRMLALLLAGVAIIGFAIVIMLAVMLRYGHAHHLIAGL